MSLSQAIILAKQAFDRVARRTWCVTPAVPILFFGNLGAYRASPLRVLTVGLNPSLHEFPEKEPLRRFPALAGEGDPEPSRYLDAMSDYFDIDPYSAWFNTFKPLLKGMEASFYGGGASRALHTDICSPVATSPTWNDLDEADRKILESDGVSALAPASGDTTTADRGTFARMAEPRFRRYICRTGKGRRVSQSFSRVTRCSRTSTGCSPKMFFTIPPPLPNSCCTVEREGVTSIWCLTSAPVGQIEFERRRRDGGTRHPAQDAQAIFG